jgi:hypothetical protein
VIDRLAAKSNIRRAGRDWQRGTPAPNLIQAGRPKGFPGNSRQPAQGAPVLARGNPARASAHDPLKEAYDALPPKCALKGLAAGDKAKIWAFLTIFAENKECPPRFPYLQEQERAARAGVDALRLAIEIEEVLKKDHGEVLNRRLRNSRHLPAFLVSFTKAVSPIYTLGATESRREHALIDWPLIYVCHFIRLKTGAWHDEQVADLLRTMRSDRDDFFGDAIRKKRRRFKSEYPVFFAGIEDLVRRRHAPPSFWDQVAAGLAFGEKPMSQP